VFAGHIRNNVKPFSCPNCSKTLIYNANLGIMSKISGGFGVVFFMLFLSINPSDIAKLYAALFAFVLIVVFFLRERLELYKDES